MRERGEKRVRRRRLRCASETHDARTLLRPTLAPASTPRFSSRRSPQVALQATPQVNRQSSFDRRRRRPTTRGGLFSSEKRRSAPEGARASRCSARPQPAAASPPSTTPPKAAHLFAQEITRPNLFAGTKEVGPKFTHKNDQIWLWASIYS